MDNSKTVISFREEIQKPIYCFVPLLLAMAIHVIWIACFFDKGNEKWTKD